MHTTNNYVMVLRPEASELAGTGIILTPEAYIQNSCWGWVVGVGEGIADAMGKVRPLPFEIGDLVYYAKFSDIESDYTPEGCGKVHFIHEGDIMLRAASLDLKNDPDNFAQSLVPIGNWLRVEPLSDSVQRTTPSGIVLPDISVKRPSKAKVLAVGPGQHTMSGLYPIPVKPGDIVRHVDQAFYEIPFKDLGLKCESTFVVNYADVLAVETAAMFTDIKANLARMNEVIEATRELR